MPELTNTRSDYLREVYFPTVYYTEVLDYTLKEIESEQEAFFLRIMNTGDYRYKGADLGILVTRGRAMDNKFRLTQRAKQWITGIRAHYRAKPLTRAAQSETTAPAFKIL